MKIWIDILTPKQAMFFKPLIEKLEDKNNDLFISSRAFHETIATINLLKINANIFGEYGQTSLESKLINSYDRLRLLTPNIVNFKPDIALSFSSPDCARISFGLNTPHICVSDSPHAFHTSKLTIPLSDLLLTPWVIPYNAWTKHGINKNKIIKYHALDPIVWIKNPPSINKPKFFNLNRKNSTILIRLPETAASYLQQYNSKNLNQVIERIIDLNYNVILLCRYESQFTYYKNKFKNKIIIPQKFLLSKDLFSVTDLFIGLGGTMTAEAVLLGIPTISSYPGNATYVENYLIKKNLISRLHDPTKILSKINTIFDNKLYKDKFQLQVKNFVNKMEDPVDKIIYNLENFYNTSKKTKH